MDNTELYYKALYQIACDAVNSATSVEEVLTAIVRSTTTALGASGCSLTLISPQSKQILSKTTYGINESSVEDNSQEFDSATIDSLMKGMPSIVRSTSDTGVIYRAQTTSEGISSVMLIPATSGEEILGIARIYTDHPTEFSADKITFLMDLAGLCAVITEKVQLFESVQQGYERRLRRKAAQLKQGRKELKELEEAKNRLLDSISTVAHDLKSPLAAIESYFAVMLGGYSGDLNEKQRGMIERSSIRINDLLGLISNLLDISRIEAGQMSQEMDSVSLGELATAAIEDAQSLAGDKNITISKEIPTDLPPIHGSSLRIRQVLSNLIGNAVKFTEEGGTVTLTLANGTSEVICTISDTGIGIPEHDIPHIFGDFYRASNANVAPGTGLGLSIVKRIIEAHGGRIWVESPSPQTGAGTEFSFSLPVLPITGATPMEEEKSAVK